VRVQVQLFATLTIFLPAGGREGVATLDVPDRSTVHDVVRHLGIPPEFERVTLVNGGDATPERALSPGDVVAIFPPLSGGQP
jgi:molybdopterin converting factor small subunit